MPRNILSICTNYIYFIASLLAYKKRMKGLSLFIFLTGTSSLIYHLDIEYSKIKSKIILDVDRTLATSLAIYGLYLFYKHANAKILSTSLTFKYALITIPLSLIFYQYATIHFHNHFVYDTIHSLWHITGGFSIIFWIYTLEELLRSRKDLI